MMTFVRRDQAHPGPPPLGAEPPAPSFLVAAREAIAAPATEVVSFDVFDTLLKRRARIPVAFFETIGARLAREGWLLPQLSPGQFRAQRVAAERRARIRRKEASGHTEVRLAEVWQEMAGLLAPGAAGPEEAAEAEFAVERDHIFGNAPVLDLLAFAAQRGRRIALVSDTYLSAEQLVRLLRRAAAGRNDLDPASWRVFASAEHGTGKAGGLFDVMLRGMGPSSPGAVVHLGDIYAADIEPAARRGIRAVMLPNGTAESWEIIGVEDRYRAHAPSLAAAGAAVDPIAAGELTSLRNAALLHGRVGGTFDHFAFGCAVLGPILDHYLRWVERVLDRLGPGTLACGLLREGGFLAELLAERRPRQPIVALGISRLTMARAALTEVTAETLTAALPTRHAIPFAAFCARLGLSLTDFPRGYWTQSLSTRDAPMVEEVVGLILADPALKARVAAEAAAFRSRMERHLANVLGTAGGRAAVLLDVGWACSIQDRLIRGFGVPAERLTGLYLALNDRGLERITAGQGLLAAGCLFDGTEGHRLASPALRFIEIMEQSATPALGSVIDYDEAGAPIFGDDHIPPAQRAERAEVQRGIRTYLAHAARHRAETGATGDEASEAAQRAHVQAIFLRASLAPTAAERALFTHWLHDDSFADGALDALVPEPHRRLAPFMTPAQLTGAGFLHTYWPFGTLDADSRLIAEQGAAARLLGDRFELFAQEVPIGLEVVLDGGPGWTLARFPRAGVNGLQRAALEFESNVPLTDRLLLQFRPERPLRVVFQVACFSRPGGAAGEERQELVVEDTGLAALLRRPGSSAVAPPGAAWELPGDGTLTTIQLRLPERVMRWQGRMRAAFGLRIEEGGIPLAPAFEAPSDAPESHSAGGEPKPKGWFDTFLGARTPLADGPLALDAAAEVLSCQGWLLDAAGWAGPDSVELVLEPEGEGEAVRIPGELYPRPDLPRGFKRAIRGLTGCRARLPLSALPAGRYARIAWEGRFGDRTARVEAPYAATVAVEDGARRRIAIEVTGATRYA